MKTLLHLGCGGNHANIPEHVEIRVDMDEAVKPDIVGGVSDLSWRETGSVDVIIAQHVLEHLEPVEGEAALREWLRVLNEDGYAVIAVPDIREAAKRIAGHFEDRPCFLYGPHEITPMDIIFGGRRHMPDHLGQRHCWGFTDTMFVRALQAAGFASIALKRDAKFVQLVAVASSTPMSSDDLTARFPKEAA
jgi:SAM-dependent methyltransferase